MNKRMSLIVQTRLIFREPVECNVVIMQKHLEPIDALFCLQNV